MSDYIARDDIGLTNLEIFMCDGDYKAALKMLLEKIEKAPAADVVEVRHGRWKHIVYHNGCTPDEDMICSECEASGLPNWNYCPSCGARMDGGMDNVHA